MNEGMLSPALPDNTATSAGLNIPSFILTPFYFKIVLDLSRLFTLNNQTIS